jgi:haloalkane dehalogenase
MQRRDFLTTAATAAAGGVLGCAGVRRPRTGGEPAIDAAAFHATRRFVATPFGRIAYVERGRGPAALFVHGLPLNGFQWRGALTRLADVRRCLAPDSMGLGYGEIVEGQDVGPEAQVAMLLHFLDALRVGTVDLVASDSGGAVAQILVARHPERVRTLLLTNCDVHEDSPPPALAPVIEAARAGRFADDVLLPQLRDPASRLLAANLGGCCYTRPDGLTEEALEVYLRPLVATPLRKAQLHAYCVALERNPLLAVEPALRASRVPLRVVWGTGDTIFDPAGPEWLDRAFPRSQGVRRLDGANLFFPEERPDVIEEEARALWSRA